MAVAGDQWPLLVYENQEYDEEVPWRGLFRSNILVWVGISFAIVLLYYILSDLLYLVNIGFQAYIHLS